MLTPTQTLNIIIKKTVNAFNDAQNGNITYEQFNSIINNIEQALKSVTYNVGPEYEMQLDEASMAITYAKYNCQPRLQIKEAV